MIETTKLPLKFQYRRDHDDILHDRRAGQLTCHMTEDMVTASCHVTVGILACQS